MIFDSYSRRIKVDIRRKPVQVSVRKRPIQFINGAVVLPRHETRVTASDQSSVVHFTKSTPQPFQILNTPALILQPDGSYLYLPQIVGGVSPYAISFGGILPPGWVFNGQNGQLSRPPQ